MGRKGGGGPPVHRHPPRHAQPTYLQWLAETPLGFIVATASVGGTAALVSLILPSSSGANSVPTLTLIVIFALTFIATFTWFEKDSAKPVRKRSAKVSAQRYRGVVKRYSHKHGWGLICAEETLEDPGTGQIATRQDVRFYEDDQKALNLQPKDWVAFNVMQDFEAPSGWLKVVRMTRTEPGDVLPSGLTSSGGKDDAGKEQGEQGAPAEEMEEELQDGESAPSVQQMTDSSPSPDVSADPLQSEVKSAPLEESCCSLAASEVKAEPRAVESAKKAPRVYMLGRPSGLKDLVHEPPTTSAPSSAAAAAPPPPQRIGALLPTANETWCSMAPLSPRTQAMVAKAEQMENWVLNPSAHILPGQVMKLTDISVFPEAEMTRILGDLCKRLDDFRLFAGRGVRDFKIGGTRRLRLPPPDDVLNALLTVMVAIAERTLRSGQELALLQLMVNHFADGDAATEPHSFGCRQVCVSLGASREVILEGTPVSMGHGDCLLLGTASTSTPASSKAVDPQVTICLFYGSADEYANGELNMSGMAGRRPLPGGESLHTRWWFHPVDVDRSPGLFRPAAGNAAAATDGEEVKASSSIADSLLGGNTVFEAELRARWLADRDRAAAQRSSEAQETLYRAKIEAHERDELRKRVETATRDDLQRMLNARLKVAEARAAAN